MKYIVICVLNREIYLLGIKDSLSEAQKIMLDDFLEIFYGYGYTKKDFEKQVNSDNYWDYWGFTEYYAWINAKYEDYDWRILETEV